MITYPNLYHLKYFVDAVALGSISGAAQKNLVTHPAISRAISALEKHLGTPLLDHRKKSFKVTEAGYVVVEQAKVLLAAASEFETLSLKLPAEETVVIKIGLSRTLSTAYLNPLLQEIKRKFPLSTVQVRFGTTNEIIEAVASGSVDLGMTIGSQSLATLKQTVVKKGQFLLVESTSKSDSDKRIESKSFILTEPRFETEKLRAGYRKQFGKTLPTLFEISSWEVIAQQVQRGLGVGLLPDILVSNWKAGSFRVLKAAWFDCPYGIYLHSLKARPQSQVLEFTRDILASRRP
ncbi:LysR family transcriptional regulator [Bdellovibrio sp.]|uniref:LysR family transcriptional regulator n=1 Tax=Bdellovibrio sp. TaxID=28201 RepID=UPI003221FF7F